MSQADIVGLILVLVLLIIFLMASLYEIVYKEKTKTNVNKEVRAL